MEPERPEEEPVAVGPPANQPEVPDPHSPVDWIDFTVTKVDKKRTPKIIIDMTQEQRRKEDFNKLYYTVMHLKTEGTRMFYAGFYEGALKCYETAEEICEAINPDTDERKEAVCQIHQEVCNQAALTYFKTHKYQNAIRYSQLGAEIPGNDVLKAKSHFWWAKALLALDKHEECRAHLIEAKRLDNGHPYVDIILEEVNSKMNG